MNQPAMPVTTADMIQHGPLAWPSFQPGHHHTRRPGQDCEHGQRRSRRQWRSAQRPGPFHKAQALSGRQHRQDGLPMPDRERSRPQAASSF
jgi:hypothetical protein